MLDPRTLLRLSLLISSLFFAFLAASPIHGSGGGINYVVNSNGDPGVGTCDATECTLREAITKANLLSGNQITFALPNCPATPSACVIQPMTPLPPITKATTIIDGTVQPGYSSVPIVVIDGSSAGATDGISITADNAVVWGLWIRNFNGIGISDYVSAQKNLQLNFNHLENNASGGAAIALNGASSELDMDGNTIINNGFTGVLAAYATMDNAMIQNNVISGNNGRGVEIAVSQDMTFTNNTISGNLGGKEGVYAQATTTNNVTFTNNRINNNTAEGVVAVAFSTQNFTGNTISGNAGAGVSTVANTVTNLTLKSNVIADNQGIGYAGYASNSMMIDGNTVTNNTGSAGIYTSGATVTNATVTNNEVSGSTNGFTIAAINSLTMSGNFVHDNSVNGVDASSSTMNSADVTHNNFLANGSSGLLIAALNPSVHFNRFAGNTNSGLGALFGNTVDGTQNWWGCNGGPGTTGCDNAYQTNDNPWLVLGINAAPDSIPTGGTSTITGDLTHNSNTSDTSFLGHLPDGIKLLFATDLGSVGSLPVNKPITNGKATTTLHAPNSPGTAHVSVTLDNQTVTTGVAIVSSATPTPTPSPTLTPPPTGSPTPTPGAQKQGDTNCDGKVTGSDGLPPLLYSAGIHLTSVQSACPAIASGSPPFGDVNCDGVVNAQDVIAILRFAAEVPVIPTQPAGCTPLGSLLS